VVNQHLLALHGPPRFHAKEQPTCHARPCRGRNPNETAVAADSYEPLLPWPAH
jgi:hypothetical protein